MDRCCKTGTQFYQGRDHHTIPQQGSLGQCMGHPDASRMYFQKEPGLKIGRSCCARGHAQRIYIIPSLIQSIIDRRNTVINQMVVCKQHFSPMLKLSKLKAKPPDHQFQKLDENVGIAPYFRDVLKDKLKEWCATHKNPKTDEPYDILRDGLRIYTTPTHACSNTRRKPWCSICRWKKTGLD